MRMRVISEVSHEIWNSAQGLFEFLSAHANWIRNEVSLCEEFIDEMITSQASESPDIARHTQAHGTFNNGYQRK